MSCSQRTLSTISRIGLSQKVGTTVLQELMEQHRENRHAYLLYEQNRKHVLPRYTSLYCPCSDDCFIVTSTQSEMDKSFWTLGQQTQWINLTRETSRNGWIQLNILFMLFLWYDRVKLYRKESLKNIVHSSSANPAAVKRAALRKMLKTATGVSSSEREFLRIPPSILHSNAYQTKPRRTKKPLKSDQLRMAAATPIMRSLYQIGLRLQSGNV